jgi:PadR family transcriptional regulator, regulatory protein AphA
MSGYELLKDMDQNIRYFWAPARSQVYALLPRLVDQGFATARSVEQKERPDKTIYKLTRAGREALDAWLAEPVEHDNRGHFLLKLFLSEHVRADIRPLVAERREWAHARLAELRELERQAERDGDGFHGVETLRHGIDQLRATVRWADAALRRLG